MTRIGAVCLVTIGVWVAIELAVQCGHYRHQCRAGSGAALPSSPHCTVSSQVFAIAGT